MDIAAVMSGFKPRHTAISVALLILVGVFATPQPATSVPRISAEPGVFVPGVPGRARPAPPIRIGSPVDGTWGKLRVSSTTPAGGHHLLAKASPVNHWAVDLPSPSGVAVIFYASTASAADDAAVTAAITQIVDNSTCRLGGGGDFVTVGIYYDGVLVGRATYAHLNRDPFLRVGMQIPRWGATLGTVAYLSGRTTGGSGCWTGPHVHLEMRAEYQRSCWVRERSAGERVRRGDPLGFVGSLADLASACD